MTTRPIIIKGKTAKAIYDRILSKDKATNVYNERTDEEPVLRVEER